MHILIADDHALLVDMLEGHLRALGDVTILKAFDWEQARAAAASAATPVDLALLDLSMPGMSGLDGLREFRSAFPEIRVAVISGDATPATARGVLGAGAVGFLPKTTGGRAMLHAVRRILAGEVYVPASVTRLAEGAPPMPGQPPLTRLSAREIEVLKLLARGHSNKEISRWLGIAIVTVTAHLSSIYRKLDVSNRTGAALKAKETGLDRDG